MRKGSLTSALLLCATVLCAQGREPVADQLVSDMLQAPPGARRAELLSALSKEERDHGRSERSVEYALLATLEAERVNDRTALPGALLELTRAQRAKGDLEGATMSGLRGVSLLGEEVSAARIPLLLEMAGISLEVGSPERALEYLSEVGPIPEHQRNERLLEHRLEATAKQRTLPPAELLAHLNVSIGEVMRYGDADLQAELLAMMATAHARTGGTLRAIELEEQVMGIALKNGRTLQAGIAANNLAELLNKTPRAAESMELYQRAIILLEDAPNLQRSTMVNSAVYAALQGDPSRAKEQLSEALTMSRNAGDGAGEAMVMRTVALVQLYEGDASAALTQAGTALRIAKEAGSESEQALLCDLIAAIHMRQGDAASARSFERSARTHRENLLAQREAESRETAAERARILRQERENLERLNREQQHRAELTELALTTENQEKRLALLLAEKDLEESGRREEMLARERAQKELQLAEAALAAERNERLIRDLENTKLLQAMSMDRMTMEREQRQRDVELLEQKNQASEAKTRILELESKSERTLKRYSLYGALAMLGLAIYMAWAWSVQRKKKLTIITQKRAIEAFNTELESKNQDIESSLRYAQTIQSAIVPDEARLQAIIPDSFLYYQPLANVSGDLPYVKRVGDKLYVAAIDCTGHGVPAAMMTFIAYYGLNELIAKEPHAGCGRILDMLHLHVADTMRGRHANSGYDDGFDIGLCCIDLRSGDLKFSGAQLPLLIQRDGQLERVKGDVLPLG
ncbi:MAG: SpoIIE family protein phosphatase, partial [Flavobacteriales bacterium]